MGHILIVEMNLGAPRIDQAAAEEVSSAFDDLQSARLELEIMREIGHGKVMGPAFYEAKCSKTVQYLNTAFGKLQKAQAKLLYKAPRDP